MNGRSTNFKDLFLELRKHQWFKAALWNGLAAMLTLVTILQVGLTTSSNNLLWQGIFHDRVARLEEQLENGLASISLPSTYLKIDRSGTFLQGAHIPAGLLQLKDNGLFGKIKGLAPGERLVLFYNEILGKQPKVNYVRSHEDYFEIVSIDPKEFLPLSTTPGVHIALTINGICWYADDPAIVGNVLNEQTFLVKDGKLLFVSHSDVPSVADSRLHIQQDIGLQMVLLGAIITLVVLVSIMSHNTNKRIGATINIATSEHEKMTRLMTGLSECFSSEDCSTALHATLASVHFNDSPIQEYQQYHTLLTTLAGRFEQVLKGLKLAETALRDNLNEKQNLIEEIFHRTRNNMTVILGLVKLSSFSTESDHAKRLLDQLGKRIFTLVQVQKELYAGKDLSRVDLAVLFDNLIKVYETSSPPTIHFARQLSPVELLIDSAAPLCLAVDELVRNAIEHAFPERGGGTITIACHTNPDGSIVVSVKDNGKGILTPPTPDATGRTGLTYLLPLAVSQLHADMQFRTDQGVTCTLIFKDNLYIPRV